jgi:parallel beta-helix repeat protein
MKTLDKHPVVLYKTLVIGINLLLFFMSITSSIAIDNVKKSSLVTYSSNTLYVGGSGPGNYTKIQDAINNTNDGDTVFVYKGTYYEYIIINKSIDLIGENRITTVIDGYYSGDVVSIHNSSVSVNEITVQHSGQGMWDHAIEVKNKSPQITNIHIDSCIVKDSFGGIRFDNIKKSQIKECFIHNNTASCITVYLNSNNIKIINCTVENNGEELKSKDIYYNLKLSDSWNKLRNKDGWGGGISIAGIENQCSDISITNCSILSNYASGISVSRSKNVIISNNKISRNTKQGIFSNGMPGPVKDIYIHDNLISDNGQNNEPYYWDGGIYLQNCIDYFLIENNTITSNRGYGIYFKNSQGHEIKKNKIINNDYDGLYLYHYSTYNIPSNSNGSSNNTVSFNSILNNNHSGIVIVKSYNNKIKSNEIINNTGGGIYIKRGSKNNSIFKNNIENNGDITDNSSAGIFFEGPANDNKIISNNIMNNNWGIKLFGNKNIIRYNNFIKNQGQATFTQSRRNKWHSNYWDDWSGIGPKIIFGIIYIFIKIPWINLDLHPAKEPYDI